MTSRRARDERASLLLPLEVDEAPRALPRHLAPMQPRLGASAFNDAEYLFEVKWDGVRALVSRDAGGVRVVDRHGDDLLEKLPELARAARQIPEGTLLDGEVVVCDARGRPRYEMLAARLGPSARRGRGPIFLAFDLLYESSLPLMDRPLLERRERLARLVQPGGPMLVPEHLDSDGEPFLEAVREFGLEGIVGKRRDSAYVPGARTADWLKMHATPRLDVVVCGAVRRDGVPHDLLCGAYRERSLAFVGRAYVPAFLREYVARQLEGLARETSPFDAPVELVEGLAWFEAVRCAIVEGPEAAESPDDSVARDPQVVRLGAPAARPGALADANGFPRDARLRSFRVDARPEDCRLEEPVRMPSGAPRLERDRPRLVVLRSLFPV